MKQMTLPIIFEVSDLDPLSPGVARSQENTLGGRCQSH